MATFAQKDRTTLTLRDPSLLRGCASSVILGCCGKRLRRSAGGSQVVANERESDYAQSFVVEQLDVFLSHSWHAPWIIKYFTLLFWFNGFATLTVCAIAMFISLILMRPRQSIHPRVSTRQPSELNQSYFPPPLTIPPPPRPTINGTINYQMYLSFIPTYADVFCHTFVLVCMLLSWHHIASRTKVLRTAVFLDKVCIHQTIAEKKIRGINALGAFLAKSRRMLLAWDGSYFKRLWCLYELSAFKRANPKSRIDVVPIQMGGAVAMFFALLCVRNLMFAIDQILSAPLFDFECPRCVGVALNAKWLIMLLYELAFILAIIIAQSYIYEFRRLAEQVEDVSVEQARCFCCDNDHIYPTSGESMICDRKVVYSSIAVWYGNGDEPLGLEKFNTSIRATLRHDISISLGSWIPVPYFLVCLLSLPDAVMRLHGLRDSMHVSVIAAELLETVLLRFHFRFAVLFGIARISSYGNRYQESVGKVFRTILASIGLIWLRELEFYVLDHMAGWRSPGCFMDIRHLGHHYPQLGTRIVSQAAYGHRYPLLDHTSMTWVVLESSFTLDVFCMFLQVGIVATAYLRPALERARHSLQSETRLKHPSRRTQCSPEQGGELELKSSGLRSQFDGHQFFKPSTYC